VDKAGYLSVVRLVDFGQGSDTKNKGLVMKNKSACSASVSALLPTVAILSLALVSPAIAQQKSRVMPLAQVKSIITATKDSGWVAFSAQKSTQNIYFSHLQSWHCSLKEIRYSYNTKDLDRVFPLVECNPQLPNNVPGDPKWIVNLEKPGTAKTVAVQVVFEDGTESSVAVYEPCENVGDQVCTWLVE